MARRKNNNDDGLAFEDSLNDDWSRDLNTVEVPLGTRPLLYLGLTISVIALIVLGRVAYLNLWKGGYYQARAQDNMAQAQTSPAPRGVIYDREGNALVENQAAFAATLNARAFLADPALQSSTLDAVQTILGIASDTVWSMLRENSQQDFATPVILAENLTPTQLVNLKALTTSTINIQSDFERQYLDGPAFASVIGYTGRVSKADLDNGPALTSQDFVGKAGIEQFYDATLRGTPGVNVLFTNARGQVLRTEEKSVPTVGASVHLTIDGGLQSYVYARLASGLQSLNRPVGIALAINPQTGEVLSLVNLPGFDNNLFSHPASSTAQIQSLLTSANKPLFDRVVSGFYNPGSTIKPLDGVAALKENVIDPSRTIFSPGYILVPNPYNSSTPTKYLDWRYQGSVNLASALAQSSDVYFYVVVGGSPSNPASTPMLNDPSDYGVSGLGITKLDEWWKTFGLGKPAGIDMPNEAAGFLPTPDWKQSKQGTPWLLGDTYNVAIGQGDLLLSPVQLLDYISGIANGGKIYKPFLNASSTPQVNEDLTDLLPQIQEVQKGMRLAVTSPQGTAYTLNNLPADVCAKTGSAQVQNNQQENAIFVGYMPCNNPQIALLILIENSKQGSLNAVPIAKDVLNWYYDNRLNGQPAGR
jgi:penicillin-binding protein 2